MRSTPDHLIIVTGFGNKGIDLLAKELERKLHISRTDIIAGCPPELADWHPSELVARIAEEKARFRRGRTGPYLDVSDSYGALLDLAELARGGIAEVSQAFLIDGPLSPHISVGPPANGVFDAFRRQYEERPSFAYETLGAFHRLPPEQQGKVTTVGSRKDHIVSPDAKSIPGVGHFTLDLEGHSLTPDKIRAVTAIVVSRVIIPMSLQGELRGSPPC